MRIRIIPALVVAFLLLFAGACSNSGGDDSSSNQPAGNGDQTAADQGADGAASDDLVLSAIEALGQSADDFQAEVTSLQGTMAMDMSMEEMSFGFGGDFAFQSPDRMQMTMEFTGGEDTIIDLSEMGTMEILLVGDVIYMKMGFLGDQWVKASLDDLGVDAAQFRELLSDQSPFDYSALVEELGGDVQVQELGIEDVDGRSLRHYRISSDFQTLMGAMSGAFGDDFAGDSFPVDEIGGPVVMDLWLDTESLLPYKLTAKGSFVVDASPLEDVPGNISFNMSVVIDEYNGDIAFPDPPTDAIDFADFGDEMFGEPETE